MSAAATVHAGGCLCGSVRYEVHGTLRPVIMCHCSQCRRMTGHYLAATAARRAEFRLTSEVELRWYDASAKARRGFCGRCGSTLFWDGVGRGHISIAAGSLDDTQGLKTACHIFVADKGDYYEITDGKPQYSGGDAQVQWS